MTQFILQLKWYLSGAAIALVTTSTFYALPTLILLKWARIV
jgi:hypothetical protein